MANAYASLLGADELNPVSINARSFPEGMPEEYQCPYNFEQYMSLPSQYLDAWFRFYKPDEDLSSLTPFEKAKAIWFRVGGHPNQVVEPEPERNHASVEADTISDVVNTRSKRVARRRASSSMTASSGGKTKTKTRLGEGSSRGRA
ncbi:hypothetical protein IAR55_005082 [Kwoniella newhampshirensis]|uniref:Uncharacterized protein n=1 Tax=Kwoniella newhampshirensis TaxID=1651941 RepID=A0AAW0YIT7_9TREE